jgi:glutamyl/glutaminyl-tRNA synthetase
MKKLVALTLVLVSLLTIFVGCGKSEEESLVLPVLTVEDTLEARQTAVVELAKAFWRKNPYMQYDNKAMNDLGANQGWRPMTDWESTPEHASWDMPVYTVCSAFAYDAVFQSFAYSLLKRRPSGLTKDLSVVKDVPAEIVVFQYQNNPNDPDAGTRKLPFTRELFVEREDDSLDPPPKFFRMKKGGEVRLMGGYIVRCDDILIDENGNVTEVLCTADLETGSGMPTDGRKIKGTIHWLSATDCAETDVMMYDHLFTEADMNAVESSKYGDYLNPESKVEVKGVKIERALLDSSVGEKFQFVRKGYFCRDSKNTSVFNSVVALKDNKKF